MLPAKAAAAFYEFCLANPQSMPLIDVGAARSHAAPRGAGADLPRYRVYRQVI